MKFLRGLFLAAAAASAESSRTSNVQGLANSLQEVNSTLADAINVINSVYTDDQLHSDAVPVRIDVRTCCRHDIGGSLADPKCTTLHAIEYCISHQRRYSCGQCCPCTA